MSVYGVEKLRNEPIVIFTVYDGYSISEHLGPSIVDAVDVIEAQNERVYYVQDLRRLVMGMDEVVSAANRLSRGDSPLYHHPQIRKVINVTSDEVLRAAFEGMHSHLFGQVESEAFDTLEEALAFARGGG